MASEALARRYARAVFALAQEQDAVRQAGDNLAMLNEAIHSDEMTRAFFVAPVIDRKEKERVLREVFERHVHELALHTLLLLVRKRREALLGELVVQYRELEMQSRGMQPLTVTTALELAPKQLQSLVGELEERYGTRFEVTQKVDRQLIGGVRIMMGDRRIDGSVAGRLDELSRMLFESPPQSTGVL
jgi:F-type H+-transporting ATPase subunit delta